MPEVSHETLWVCHNALACLVEWGRQEGLQDKARKRTRKALKEIGEALMERPPLEPER